MDRFERGPTIRRDDRGLGDGWARQETRAMTEQRPSQSRPESSPGPVSASAQGNRRTPVVAPLTPLLTEDLPTLAQSLWEAACALPAPDPPIPEPVPQPAAPPALGPLQPSLMLPRAEEHLLALARWFRRRDPGLSIEEATNMALRKNPHLYDVHLAEQALAQNFQAAIDREERS